MPLSAAALKQLEHLPEDWSLIPVKCQGSRKAPVDPSSGMPLSSWEHLTWERDDFASMNGHVNAVGVKLGPPSGGLLQLDFDGSKNGLNEFDAFEQATGQAFSQLPRTVVWSSTKGWDTDEIKEGRPDGSNGNARFSMAYIIPMEFWDQMPYERNWPGPKNVEACVQCRFGGFKEDGSIKGAQAVILGAHTETPGYQWVVSPVDQQVAEAPDWLIEAILTINLT